MGINLTGEPVILQGEMETAGVGINSLWMLETIVESLHLSGVTGGIKMGEVGAGEVGTVEEAVGGEALGEEGVQGQVQVETSDIGVQILEGDLEVTGIILVLVDISTDKARASIQHVPSITGNDLSLGRLKMQDPQERQLPPPRMPVLPTWGQISETWALLQKTMLKLYLSSQLVWVEVAGEVVVEWGCPRWKISMPTGKRTVW